MRIQFKFLTGDMNWTSYGGKWLSQTFNNGDFDYCFVRSLINWEDAVGEREKKTDKLPTYHVSVSVVAPEEFKDKKAALDCHGIEEPWESLSWHQKVEVIEGYAGGATVWQDQGNNYKALFKRAQKEAWQAKFLFGFVMDRTQNTIGNTGWDWVRGDIGYKSPLVQEALDRR